MGQLDLNDDVENLISTDVKIMQYIQNTDKIIVVVSHRVYKELLNCIAGVWLGGC